MPLVAAGVITQEQAETVFERYELTYAGMTTNQNLPQTAPPEKSGLELVPWKDGKTAIYLPVFPATLSQRAWLRGQAFRELEVTLTDLAELLLKAKD